MNTTKILGYAILVLASAVWGGLRASQERRKLAILNEMIDFVKFIGENIAHFKLPLPEICTQYVDTDLTSSESVKNFAMTAADSDIKTAWDYCSLELPKEAESTFSQFVTRIGSRYADDEVSLCGYTADALEKIAVKLSGELKGRIKMWRALPPLFVTSIILIFL